MNNKFDELTKNLALAVTRRAALKKFSLGLASMALACFGLANRSEAATKRTCSTDADCQSGQVCCNGACVTGHDWCDRTVNYCCCYCVVPQGGGKTHNYGQPYGMTTALTPCDTDYDYCRTYCGSSLGCL